MVTTTDFGEKTVELLSPYYIVENYKGAPDGEIKSYFSLKFMVDKVGILNAIHDNNFMFVLADAKQYEVVGKKAYRFTIGIEGNYVDVIYLPINEEKTLVVEYRYFSDFLKDNVRPKPFSQKQEETNFNFVMSSLKFF